MLESKIKDFMLARPQSVGPTQSFINELKLNGKSPEFIQHLIETGRLDHGDSEVDLYSDAEGYVFNWGHVLEDIGVDILDGDIFISVSWNIVFDDVLEEFHRRGLRLEDLTVVCLTLLSNLEGESHSGLKIPQFLEVIGGDEASAFEFMSGGSGEDGMRKIHVAREWLAKCFLSEIVDDLIAAIHKTLQKGENNFERRVTGSLFPYG